MKKSILHASELVYLRGSRKSIRRVIREREDGKLFIVFGGQLIEVRRHLYGYCTVLDY